VVEMEQPGRGDARRRLGTALRELLDVVVQADPDEDLANEAADVLDELRRRLADSGKLDAMPLELSAIRREMSLVGGASHPAAPQIDFVHSDAGTSGTTVLGPIFEGGPGLVHGGILALLLDHAMGHASVSGNYAAMTTELTLRFRGPTPIGKTLCVTARLDRKAGRKLYLSGRVTVDGTTTVEADGVFVTLTGSNVAAIFGTRS
jgi:acyl-coenzyme A thioesterase PaaI-like protein